MVQRMWEGSANIVVSQDRFRVENRGMIVHSVRDNRVIVHSKPVTNNRKIPKIDNFSKTI